MTNEYTEFWLALLEFGDTEEKRRQNWNDYCGWKFSVIYPRLLESGELIEFQQRLRYTSGPGSEGERRFNQLAEEHGGHPPLPSGPSGEIRSFMDFSGMEFPDNVSFAGRILIGANFRQTVFNKQANFTSTEFLGPAQFDNVKFHSTQLSMAETGSQLVSFFGSIFHDAAFFRAAQFSYVSNFGTAVFRREASFYQATFPSRFVRSNLNRAQASFRLSQFQNLADFRKAVFGADVEFDNAEMAERANFSGAEFHGAARFHNCGFRSTTLFRNAVFWKPPDFFETELHEDADFSGADWTKAESSYHRSIRRDELVRDVSIHANDAMRAWDRLALIMSQREKLPERHEFFRLKMRAQRQRDGRSLLSFLNWLFDVSSDYGWSVGRALTCWAGQFVAMGIILAGLALNCSPEATSGRQHVRQVVLDGLSLSFANSHAFLRLTSGGGWLHGSRDSIVNSCEADWLFNYIGLAQAVFGPVLLFLVLLALRNRFRLG